MEQKKGLLEFVKELEQIIVKEKFSPREILMILRELENSATIALVMEHLIHSQQQEEQQNETSKTNN